MIEDPDKRLAEIRALAAERKLLRMQGDPSDPYERRAAEEAYERALRDLERLRSAERG
jgi:hypothetical protein